MPHNEACASSSKTVLPIRTTGRIGSGIRCSELGDRFCLEIRVPLEEELTCTVEFISGGHFETGESSANRRFLLLSD